MKVIEERQLAVDRKPGSYVNLPVLPYRERTSMTSGPMVLQTEPRVHRFDPPEALRVGASNTWGIVAQTSAYIGAGLGPGPRDGLMTGLAARTGWSIRLVRTGIALTILAIGWALGGTAGIGTILYAVPTGPVVQRTLPFFTMRDSEAGRKAKD